MSVRFSLPLCILVVAARVGCANVEKADDDISMLQVNQTVVSQKSIKRTNHSEDFLPKELSKSLGNSLGGLRDKVCDGAETLLKPVLGALNGKLSQADEIATGMSAVATENAKELVDNMGPSLSDEQLLKAYEDKANKLLTGVTEGWEQTSSAMQTMEAAVTSQIKGAGFDDAAQKIGTALAKVRSSTDSVLGDLQEAIEPLTGIAEDTPKGVQKRLQRLNATMETVLDKVDGLGDEINDGIEEMVSSLQAAVTSKIGNFCNGTVTNALEGTEASMTKIVDDLTEGVTESAASLNVASEQIKSRPAYSGCRVSASIGSVIVMILVVSNAM